MALLVLRSRLGARRRQRAGLLLTAKGSRIVGGDGLLVILIVNGVVAGISSRRMGIGREVHQVHRRRRGGLGGDAVQLSADASLAWFGIVAFDPGDGARTTGVRDSPTPRRGGRATTFLGRVVVVVGHMAAEEILASKGFLADLTDEAAPEGVGLNMTDEMLWARIRSSTIAAGVKIVAAMVCRLGSWWGAGGCS